MNWFTKFTMWMNRAMSGRHGGDQLSMALLVLYCAILILSDILRLPILFYLALLILIWSFYRMFSRNHEKRWKENAQFLKFWSPVCRWFRGLRSHFSAWRRGVAMRVRDRKVCRYYKCPKCKNVLRVPKGKGKIAITCPVCRTEFVKKT